MTREQCRENLKMLGIENPTEDAVTNYLNQMQLETKKFDKYKDEHDRAEQLQKQLDEIAKQNMTDIEKANTERDEALKKVTDFEATIKKMELKTSLAEKGIVGEDAEKLIESLGNGGLDVELLGQIIASRETNAAKAKEEEISKGSPNPGGNPGGGKDDDKPADVVMAEKMASAFGSKPDVENKDFYVMK